MIDGYRGNKEVALYKEGVSKGIYDLLTHPFTPL